MSKDCEQCGEVLVKRGNVRACRFTKRRFCGDSCRNASRAKTINALGVTVTRQELADMLGVTYSCISKRIRRGRCPVTGKRNE